MKKWVEATKRASPSRRLADLAGDSRTSSARERRPNVQSSYIVPVLSKSIVIIELLETSDRPLNVTEIAKMTGVSKSTTYRILRTLTAHGYMPHGADGLYSFRFASPEEAGLSLPQGGPETRPSGVERHVLSASYITLAGSQTVAA